MAPHSLSPSPADLKRALRAELLSRRAAVGSAHRAETAGALKVHAEWVASAAGGGAVSAFWPIGDEIDPRPLLHALAARGVPLALPRVTSDGLVFHRWRPGDRLEPARFGLLEPSATAPDVAPALMLVPLLGFDRTGHRIGYGRAYYDRAIARLRPRLALGLAFACQEVSSVPIEPHDQPLDAILTDVGRIDVDHASRE